MTRFWCFAMFTRATLVKNCDTVEIFSAQNTN